MRALRFLSGGMVSIALLAAVATLGAWGLRSSITSRAEREAEAAHRIIATEVATKGDFEVTVECIGQLAAVNSKPVVAQVGGQLVHLIANGAKVKEGDLVAVLDVERMAREVRDRERQYQQSLENLDKKRRDLSAEVEKALLAVEQAKRELEQYEAQQELELDNKRKRQEKNTADLARSEQRLERQKKLAQEQLIAGREVEQAETQIKAQRFALERDSKELELAQARYEAEKLNREAVVREAEAKHAQSLSQREDELAGDVSLQPEGGPIAPLSPPIQMKGGERPRPPAGSGGGGGRGGDGAARRGNTSAPPPGAGGAPPRLGTALMEVQMNKIQLSRVQENLAKAQIKSPAEGVVVLAQNRSGRGVQQREFQPGDQVWEGRTIATVADLSKMRVEIELDQEQARQVKRKQRAIITVDALPGESFEGEVTEISQLASESSIPGTGIPRGKRTFQAKVAIKDLKKARLLPGMSAQVRIIIEVIEEAVSVPLECVFEDDERFIVYLRRGKEFREVEVELGEESQDRVVIVKGLKGGEQVALREVAAAGGPPGAGMREAPAAPTIPKGAAK